MGQNYTLEQKNLNNLSIHDKIESKCVYYANVIVWTLLYSLPLFVLFDVLFQNSLWIDLLVFRTALTFASYIIYLYAHKKNWKSETILRWFLAIHVFMHSIACCWVSDSSMMKYFIIASLVFLFIASVTLWETINILYLILFSFVIIGFVFSLRTRIDKYDLLISEGGGLYFLLCMVAFVITLNRWQLLTKFSDSTTVVNNTDSNNNFSNSKTTKTDSVASSVVAASLVSKAVDYSNNTTSVASSTTNFVDNTNKVAATEQKAVQAPHSDTEKLEYLSEQAIGINKVASTVNTQSNIEPVDLNAVVEKLAMEFADVAQNKNINIQLNLCYERLAVGISSEKLTEALRQLIKNVFEYASHSSILSLHTLNVDNISLLEINNYGLHIGMEKLNNLFEHNQYANDTNGFAKAKHLIENLGAQLSYNSEQYKGNFYKIEFK